MFYLHINVKKHWKERPTEHMLPTDKKNINDDDTFDEIQVKRPNMKKTITVIIIGIAIAVLILTLLLLPVLFLKMTRFHGNATSAVVNKTTSHQDQHVTGNVSSVTYIINLGKSKDRILLFEPSMKYCFNISRSGRYYLAISLHLTCSSLQPQHVSIKLKNETLENPALITNPTLCAKYTSNIFVQKTFQAKKYSQILMESSISLKGYSGNFLKLEWYKKCL